MGKLIPEKRLDKNGRLVTKHVKPQGDISASASKIPAPMFANATTFPTKVDGIKSLWECHRISRGNHTLEDFDPRAVTEVERLLGEFDSGSGNPSMGLQVSITKAFDLMQDEGNTKGFNNLAVFGKHVFPHANLEVDQYITPLHDMTAPREVDYLNATEDERNSAVALVEFTVRAENLLDERVIRYSTDDPEEILDFTELRDPHLSRFIMDNPDKVDDVLDILKSAKDALPVDLIKERLAHSEKSLRDGVL